MRQLALENQFERSRSSATRFAAWSCLAFLIVALMIPSAAKAQLAGTGEITGTVTDSSGAVVGAATVTATLVDQNTSTVRTTTGAGDYTITPLTPGVYSVTVTAKGFETFVQQNVVVNALQTVSLNIKLTIGAAQQTITVTAAPPVLETTDATLGAVMDNQMYSSLPLLMGAGGNADQRRATDFASLMPGVVPVWVGSNNATDASLAVNGGNPSGGTSEIYIDGINLPAPDGVGDVRFIWSAIGMDSIDQFQVETTGYPAQYAGQGVQNYSIKQGSNEWHGGVYEYIRNTVLDAWRFTSKVPTITGTVPTGSACVFGSPATSYCAPGGVKPAEIMNEVGAKFGGPILHNKLFMFYNYGQYRNQNGPLIKLQTIPTTAMLNGDFSQYSMPTSAGGTGYQIWDPGSQTPGCLGSTASPCSRAQFVSTGGTEPAGTLNVIPANRISQAATFINKYMAPYEASTLQNVYSNNIATGYPSGLANWYQGGRIDYDMNSKNQVSIIVEFGRQASTGPNSSGAANQLGPPFNTNQAYTPKTTVDIVKDTYTINSHMVNQASVAYARYKSLSTTPDEAPQFAASNSGLLNTPAGQASFFPSVVFSGGVDGPLTEAGYDENQKVSNSYSAADNLQWQIGKHSLTLGGQVVWDQFNLIKNLTNSGPLAYTFSNVSTSQWSSGTSLNSTSGSPVASYEIGAVNSSSVSVGLPGYGSRWLDPSFWGQDDWKINPKLTVNLGVRWDIWPALHATHSIMSWLNPTATNSVTGNLGTLAFAGGNASDGYHTGLYNPSPTNYANIAPRAGFAYALDSKTVIRSSYGLDFARGDWNSGSQSGSASTVGFAPSASAPGGTVNQPSFYWDGTQCTDGTADSVPCGWTGSVAAPAPPAGGTSLAEFGTSETTALTNAGAQSPVYWNPHYGAKTPEYLNWNFGVERQLTNNMSISVSYVGSEGHFLSVSKAIGSRNNEIPESFAALAGYNLAGGVATPCTGVNCNASLLTQNSGTSASAPMVNTNLAIGLGFTPPNPYVGNTYYYKNAVSSYMQNFPQYSGISDTTSFVGNENWNALEISIRQRPTHGLNFMLNYTYSKAIDDLGTFRVGDNDRLDRALSTADIPQNVVGTLVYQLPFGRGHIWGDNFFYRAIASDWTASTIFSYHSGFPIALIGSGCGSASILNQCMPNVVSGQAGRANGPYGKNTTSAPGSPKYIGTIQYINVAAFNVTSAGNGTPASPGNYGTCVNSTSTQACYVGSGTPLYVPGNAPRVAPLGMFGMGYYDDDIAVKRSFPIYREWNVAIEVDMTNLTNHVVWASPNSTVNGGSLGEITALNSSNAPRDVQGMLRINF
jgi:Carboxypeptidase regulatory-like domain